MSTMVKLRYPATQPSNTKAMVRWCHDNIHPNCKADMSHFRLSVVGMVKQWRSYDDGKSWTITIHGQSPVLTIEIADEQLATLFALGWSGVK